MHQKAPAAELRTKEHVKNLRSRVPGEEHYYLPLHSNSVLRRQGPCCCERIWALGMHRGVIYQLLDHLSMELSHEKLLDWTSGDDGGRKYWQRTNGSDFFHVDEAFDWKQYYVEPHGLCWWCKHTDKWFSEDALWYCGGRGNADLVRTYFLCDLFLTTETAQIATQQVYTQCSPQTLTRTRLC